MPSSSNNTIPRWKAQLLEKRKSAQRLRGDSIPVWKRELLKKLHSNSKLEVESRAITDDQLVISDPIVKVSQNIFVVRETKAGNNLKQKVHVNKFQQQPSFNVIKTEDVIIIENTTTTPAARSETHKMENTEPIVDDKPTQGIVSRLKNRFMNDQQTTTTTPQFNNKFKKMSVSYPNKKSITEVDRVEATDKKLPVSSIDDDPSVRSSKLHASRRANSEIELFTASSQQQQQQQQQTNGDDVTIRSSSAAGESGARFKFDRSRAASVELLAPKGYNKPDTTIKPISLPREYPKEKVAAAASSETTKVEFCSPGGSKRVELGKVKVDSTGISRARAEAYNELMQESRTFQIIPKSAKADNHAADIAPLSAVNAADDSELPCTDIDQVDLPMVVAPEEPEWSPPEPAPAPPVVEIPPTPQPETSPIKKHVVVPASLPASSEDKEQKTSPPAPAARFRPQIRSANAMFGTSSVGSSGRSFTIDPSKFKKSAAPPRQSNVVKSRETNDNMKTIVPKSSSVASRQPATIPEVDISVKKTGKRKPTVDQIEVVGGYVKLSRSLLKSTGGKKKSVRFAKDTKEFTLGQDVNANSNNNNNNNSNNNNNNSSNFFNRTGMYIPTSERNLDSKISKTDHFTEIALDPPPRANPADSTPPPLPSKKKMEERFVSFIDDHDIDGDDDDDSSSTSSSSSDDTRQAIPTTADSASFFSDVTSSDLLF